MKKSFTKSWLIPTILFIVFEILVSPWTWKLDPGSWQFFVNVVIIVILGFGWGWFMWWSFNKFMNKN